MDRDRSERALRATVGTIGTIATTAGLHTVFSGARSVPGHATAGPELESELRFYAAFYVAYGLAALRLAPRVGHDPRALHGLAGAMFLGGLGRAPAWHASGPPHPTQRALMAIELALPAALLAWQRRLQAPR